MTMEHYAGIDVSVESSSVCDRGCERGDLAASATWGRRDVALRAMGWLAAAAMAATVVAIIWSWLGPCCTDRSLGGEDWTVYQGTVPDPGQPPCHSKPTKIAVITSRSSGTE